MIDFITYPDPVLAVPCPACGRDAGLWCVRSSGRRNPELHAARYGAADLAFVEQHGPRASLRPAPDGQWVVDPLGRARD